MLVKACAAKRRHGCLIRHAAMHGNLRQEVISQQRTSVAGKTLEGIF
ncbi:hypothetical protein thalar_03636 [Litoreibacter arenae DSM 19593]|uniref:Uncharacterized protein n=1 Tax=Litoreibacter arenae DSM 19593 TaxID=1123360 RepID=S9QE96_9RHOB|nr:hypothetical protein thalar_03636 [Litoreibacter arenae DSM 19593]